MRGTQAAQSTRQLGEVSRSTQLSQAPHARRRHCTPPMQHSTRRMRGRHQHTALRCRQRIIPRRRARHESTQLAQAAGHFAALFAQGGLTRASKHKACHDAHTGYQRCGAAHPCLPRIHQERDQERSRQSRSCCTITQQRRGEQHARAGHQHQEALMRAPQHQAAQHQAS